MSYGYSFEDLLALLHVHAPAKVDAVALHRRRVEHGHLSVGLKIHCLGGGGAPVSYRYSFEDLLALLHGRAPAKFDAVALHRRCSSLSA